MNMSVELQNLTILIVPTDFKVLKLFRIFLVLHVDQTLQPRRLQLLGSGMMSHHWSILDLVQLAL